LKCFVARVVRMMRKEAMVVQLLGYLLVSNEIREKKVETIREKKVNDKRKEG
jgi:hypothetical protein